MNNNRYTKVDYAKNVGWEVSLKEMEIGPFSDVTNPNLENSYFLIEDFLTTVNNEKGIIGYIGALGVLASVERGEESRELVLADRVDRFYENMFKTSYEAGRSIIPLTVKRYTEKYRTVEEMDKNFKNIVNEVSERVTKQHPKLHELGVGKNTIKRVVQTKVIEEMSRISNPDLSDVS
ncbi:MAG: hypothetical protein KAT94_03260 [Candidatus Aenigmarchaeota archaeon]|nr:hypothetical protein [Candidatus Aenigmarchaeota archaeon]MCK4531860.1 hypothetical protein [Candidatus Aenigmarchaeota archaeon]